jgi:hypothetical protein
VDANRPVGGLLERKAKPLLVTESQVTWELFLLVTNECNCLLFIEQRLVLDYPVRYLTFTFHGP